VALGTTVLGGEWALRDGLFHLVIPVLCLA